MSGSPPVRVVHLTDCHLFADPKRELAGVATGPRLDAVLADIATTVPEPDCIVVTGDTAHDETRDAYETLLDRLGRLAPRLRILPGNHDDRELLRTVFPTSCFDDGGRTRFREKLGGWSLIGLDSQRTGETSGSLGGEQLERLAAELEAATDVDTMILVHHPPIVVGSAWLDAIGLEDAAALATLVEAHDQVRLLLCGHVHQEATGRIGGAAVLTTPAVAAQFRPGTETVVVEQSEPPAYRVVELGRDGAWSTRLRRVPVSTA